MWDLHFRTWKRPSSEHFLKAEYGGRKYCSKTAHLFLSSSGLLSRSHNFFENVIADADEEKQSALVQALASIDHLLVCLWTSARAELMTGASQGSTSIALPLFTSQNSWTDNQWAPSQISMLNLTIFFDGNHLTNATHFPWLRATIGHSVNQSVLLWAKGSQTNHCELTQELFFSYLKCAGFTGPRARCSGIQTCKLAHWKCDLTRK